jgi:hypothetical protein
MTDKPKWLALTLMAVLLLGAAVATAAVTAKRLKVAGPIITAQTAIASTSGTAKFDATTGNSFKITLAENVSTFTVSNAVAGQSITSLICQDATGSRTFAWPANMKGATAPASTASKCNVQSFICDGTNCWATAAGVTGL